MSITPTNRVRPVEAAGPVGDGPTAPRGGSARRLVGRPSFALVALLAVAGAVRLGLLLREWPSGNSDEATMGLMAMHVAEGRRLPLFMDGQSYMGTLEPLLAAVVFRASGPSLMALRLVMLLLFLLFLAALFVLARRLYGPAVATASVAALTLASREVHGHELVAQGAVPETLLAGTLLLLLGHGVLAGADAPDRAGERRRLFAWGLVAALGLWSTVLVAPFVVTSGVLVALAVRRRPGARGAPVVSLGAGLLAGATPWVVHDLTHPWRESGVVAVLGAYASGGTGLNGRSPGLGAQVTNTLTTSLAYVTGGSALAHPSAPPAWPYGYVGGWHPPTGGVVTTLWGAGVVALWAAAVALTVRRLRRPRGLPPGPDRAFASACTRLAMLAGAGLTVVAFALSRTPGIASANNARYLVGVLVCTPAVLAPLWSLAAVRPRAGGAVRAGVLLVVVATGVRGTAQAYRDAAAGRGEADVRLVVDAVQRQGIAHVYSGYRECNRLTFASREAVTCAVLAGDASGLRPGFDRYLPYRAAVRADPLAAYVFRAGDPRLASLARSACAWRERLTVAGYEVWQPAAPCRLGPDGVPAPVGQTSAPSG